MLFCTWLNLIRTRCWHLISVCTILTLKIVEKSTIHPPHHRNTTESIFYSHFFFWGFLVNFHTLWKTALEFVLISAAPPSPLSITGHRASVLSWPTITVSLPGSAEKDSLLSHNKFNLQQPSPRYHFQNPLEQMTAGLDKNKVKVNYICIKKKTKNKNICHEQRWVTVVWWAAITCVLVETCFVCEGKSENVAVVMETSVSEASDSSYGERLIWDCSLVISLCLALHLPESASYSNISEVDRQAEPDILHCHFSKTVQINYNRLSVEQLTRHKPTLNPIFYNESTIKYLVYAHHLAFFICLKLHSNLSGRASSHYHTIHSSTS